MYLLADEFKRFDVTTFDLEHLDEAIAEGRSALLLSAHLGSFDALRVMSLRSPDVPFVSCSTLVKRGTFEC